jgi:hypothetical protein
MGVPFLHARSVEDAAVDLIRAAEMLKCHRAHADRVVEILEARWSINRANMGGSPKR